MRKLCLLHVFCILVRFVEQAGGKSFVMNRYFEGYNFSEYFKFNARRDAFFKPQISKLFVNQQLIT